MRLEPKNADTDGTPLIPRTATPTGPRTAPAWATKKAPPKSKAAVRAKVTARRYVGPHDPHDHARTIAEKVIDAWYRGYGGSIEVPIGTVAALALLRQPPETGAALADWILNLQPNELPRLFKEIYLGHWLKRPDLIDRAVRLHDWAWNPDPDPQQLRAVHAVTAAALNTGLMDLTGNSDPYWRSQVDVLSPLLTGLRHKSDRKWRGEYHTPAEVGDAKARVLIDDQVQPGASFYEPCVGSGGLLRAAAQRLRELQLDPRDFHWFGIDIDPLSAACAATNAIIWDLGPRARIGCGNALKDDAHAVTLQEARESFELRDRAVGAATTIAAVGEACRQVDDLMRGSTA
jgi:N-6 DNA Methylase